MFVAPLREGVVLRGAPDSQTNYSDSASYRSANANSGTAGMGLVARVRNPSTMGSQFKSSPPFPTRVPPKSYRSFARQSAPKPPSVHRAIARRVRRHSRTGFTRRSGRGHWTHGSHAQQAGGECRCVRLVARRRAMPDTGYRHPLWPLTAQHRPQGDHVMTEDDVGRGCRRDRLRRRSPRGLQCRERGPGQVHWRQNGRAQGCRLSGGYRRSAIYRRSASTPFVGAG